ARPPVLRGPSGGPGGGRERRRARGGGAARPVGRGFRRDRGALGGGVVTPVARRGRRRGGRIARGGGAQVGAGGLRDPRLGPRGRASPRAPHRSCCLVDEKGPAGWLVDPDSGWGEVRVRSGWLPIVSAGAWRQAGHMSSDRSVPRTVVWP